MKKTALTLFCLALAPFLRAEPDATIDWIRLSPILEFNAIDTTARDALTGLTSGKPAFIYNSTTGELEWTEDGGSTWATFGGGGAGDALTTNPLSQFAATTSAQLAGVLSDEISGTSLLFGDQSVSAADAVTFATVDTGQGANELYAMNQDVESTDAVTFAGVTSTALIQPSGTTHAGFRLLSLTTAERDALTPAAGDIIYNETTGQSEGYNGSAWEDLTGAGGGGDVTKVGTPIDNQVGVWTGDGTIEGDTALTFDTAADTLAIAASGKLAFGAVNVLSDAAGTMTLSNVDALDATTEATVEGAIDTLANLTAASSLVTVGTITTGTWTGDTIAIANGGTGATTLAGAGIAELSDLAATTNGLGASLIGIEDSGTIYAATTVEAALAEVKALADAGGDFLADGSVPMTGLIDMDGSDFTDGGVLTLREQAAGESNAAGIGQIWVKNTVPSTLFFRDDNNGDYQIGTGVVDGATLSVGLTFPNSGLLINESDTGFDLGIVPTANLSADRQLSLELGDASRTLTMTGDATISGTNTGDNFSATTTSVGIGEIATQAEVDAGTDTTRWVTPDTLSNYSGLGGSSAPFIDSTAIIKGSADATKLIRMEADGITTGTTRVLTMPDSDQTVGTATTINMETAVITGIANTEIPIGTGAGTLNFAALSGDITMTNAGVTTIGANTVALTTDTTGNYAAGDGEAGAALTGDSATAFFSAGTIEHERGGLELDISAVGIGDVIAGVSAGNLEIVDGGAAADGDVLAIQADGTVNFETPAEVLIETLTPSAVASIASTVSLDDYDFIRIVASLVPANDAVDLEFTMSDDDGATYESTLYSWTTRGYNDAATAAQSNNGSDSKWQFSASVGNDTGEGVSLMLDFDNFDTARYRRWSGQATMHNQSTALWTRYGGGAHEASGLITNLKFQFSAGNIASGKIKIFGTPK